MNMQIEKVEVCWNNCGQVSEAIGQSPALLQFALLSKLDERMLCVKMMLEKKL